MSALPITPQPTIAIDPVAVARQLVPLLAAEAADAERQRRATDTSIQALHDAGLFRLMFPKRAGGPGHKLITHIETVAELAKGCAGTAWAFGLLSGVTASVASMPPQVSQLVFKTGDERARPAPRGRPMTAMSSTARGAMRPAACMRTGR